MKIIIVGAGTVGSNISKFLVREGHEVVIADLSSEKLGSVEDELDVQTIVGNGCDPEFLQKLGIGETEVLVSVTETDEKNLVCAFAAKKLGCKRVVARVRSPFYYETTEVNFQRPLGIDLLISPEILTAHELARFVATPTALVQVTLARGRIQLRTVKMSRESEFAGKLVKDSNIPLGSLVAGVRRGDKVMIARGDTRLEPDDRVTLIGLPEVLDRTTYLFSRLKSEDRTPTIAIAGAGETGLYLADLLERRDHKVIILERDRARAEYAGEKLRNARILHADATEIHTLREERIGKVDYYIAAMGDDESNVMSSLLAKELGVPKTACLIDRPDYARIVEKIGIDVAISPRIVVANRVLAMVKRGRIRSVTLLEEGELEITEYQAVSKSPIVGQPLREIRAPEGVLIGALMQAGGDVRIPRGSDIVHPGDIVIGVATTDAAEKLDALFAAAAETKA